MNARELLTDLAQSDRTSADEATAILGTLYELDRLRAALRAMLAHSCVADAGPGMKEPEDEEAERLAREALGQ